MTLVVEFTQKRMRNEPNNAKLKLYWKTFYEKIRLAPRFERSGSKIITHQFNKNQQQYTIINVNLNGSNLLLN